MAHVGNTDPTITNQDTCLASCFVPALTSSLTFFLAYWFMGAKQVRGRKNNKDERQVCIELSPPLTIKTMVLPIFGGLTQAATSSP